MKMLAKTEVWRFFPIHFDWKKLESRDGRGGKATQESP